LIIDGAPFTTVIGAFAGSIGVADAFFWWGLLPYLRSMGRLLAGMGEW
jgi:hypothetical protein